jgi:hypothetical protein
VEVKEIKMYHIVGVILPDGQPKKLAFLELPRVGEAVRLVGEDGPDMIVEKIVNFGIEPKHLRSDDVAPRVAIYVRLA